METLLIWASQGLVAILGLFFALLLAIGAGCALLDRGTARRPLQIPRGAFVGLLAFSFVLWISRTALPVQPLETLGGAILVGVIVGQIAGALK